jgi:hypothetical protein
VARYLVRLAVLAAIAALAIPAAAANAGGGLLGGLLPTLIGGNCGSDAPVFAPWADGSNYYFAGNGGFELGTSGWSFAGGAAVVPGNESYDIHSSSDSSSALIPAGGSISTSACYGLLYPSVRFFAQSVGDQPATIDVKVQAKSLLGVVSILDGGTFQVSGGWQPSPKLSTLLSALAAPLGTKSMILTVTVVSGTAQVDDLYIDPFLQQG